MKGNKKKIIRVSHTILDLSRFYGLHLNIDPSLLYTENQVMVSSKRTSSEKNIFKPFLIKSQKDCVSRPVLDTSVNLFLDELTNGKLDIS